MAHQLWKPSATTIANSNMTRFMAYINDKHNLNLCDYQELYTWSVTNPDEFWIEVWEFCDIKSSKIWDNPLLNRFQMFNAKWFINSSLNFAENLLKRRDNKIAIVYQNEQGQRRTLTYEQLFNKVAKLAKALKKLGVTHNDRVAGYLPNISEAIIAMLATTSLGAIWCSCSPDFGVQGVLDRFGQIKPKILFATDSHTYNGKNFDDMAKIRDLAKKLPSLEKIIIIPNSQHKPDLNGLAAATLYEEITKQPAAEISFSQLPFDHPIFILFSSGTTGAPKGIVHGAGNVLIQLLKELVLHTDLTTEDIFIYYTTTGWMMWNYMIPALAVGATLVLYDGSPFYPKADVLFDLIDAEKITVFGTSAKYISAIEKAKLEPIKSHQLTSLITILSTGSPLLPQNFDYIYHKVKKDVRLSSISGGTDIVSCFALGNPILPVHRGEIQCLGLGMKVEVFDEYGESVKEQKGELVCTIPFPSMPIYFWNDPEKTKYHRAYFEKYPGIWAHGDYAEITADKGIIIYGRSDAVLNPGGIRIGTAEIYREVENFAEVLESIVVGQEWENDTRIVLFVKLRAGTKLTDELKNRIVKNIRNNATPHHVPAHIVQVTDIPKTISGKIVELAVRETIHDRPVKNLETLANPEALDYFKNLSELRS